MFGIPPDPRLIEVIGWLLYAVPVLLVFLWPARLAPGPAAKRRLMAGTAVGLAALAAVMALFIPADVGTSPGPARTILTAGGDTVTATLRVDGSARVLLVARADGMRQQIPLADAGQQSVDGVDVDVWQSKVPADPGVTTTPVGLGQLASLAGGRLPVGLGTSRAPGPFDAQWSASTVYTVLAHGADVVSAETASTRVATLSGGGLTSPKTISVGGLATDWATTTDDDQAVVAQISQAGQDRAERTLWTVWLPTAFAIAAVLVVLAAVRTNRTTSKNERERIQHGEHGESPTRDEISVS
jgi:high-affinity iron transporter